MKASINLPGRCFTIWARYYRVETPSSFVFLDGHLKPFLVHKGWLHYWNGGSRSWVTLRKLNPGEYEACAIRKMPPEHQALYGYPLADES